MDILKFSNLVECTILKRISRFSVLVNIGGTEHIVYLCNTGRLLGYIEKGRRGFCIPTKKGKLMYRLVGVEDRGYAALVDTMLHEKSFEILISKGFIPWLKSCAIIKRNFRVFGSILDYLIRCRDIEAVIELKSAIMKLSDGFAGYPDAPTTRGRKQIEALANFIENGFLSYLVFVVGIPNAKGFKLYCDVDEKICYAVNYAIKRGVIFKAINIFLNPFTEYIVAGDLDLKVDLSCC